MSFLSNKEIYLELIICNARDLVQFAELEDLIIARCKGLSSERLKAILAKVEKIRTDLIKLREEIESAL